MRLRGDRGGPEVEFLDEAAHHLRHRAPLHVSSYLSLSTFALSVHVCVREGGCRAAVACGRRALSMPTSLGTEEKGRRKGGKKSHREAENGEREIEREEEERGEEG